MTLMTLERPRATPAPFPVLDALDRRDLLRTGAVVLAGGLAAGCGEDGQPEAASTADRRRRIRHDMGTTEIPAVPRRVVVVDSFTTLHTALLLDVPVVGALTFGGGLPPFAPFLGKAATAGIESIGYPDVKLETVAALRPDLIVGSKAFTEHIYDQLTEIAPTLVVDLIPQVEWKEDERALGKLYDGTPRIERALADYESRVADFKATMGARLDELEVGFVRLRPDEIRIHTRFHFAGTVMQEAGLKRPKAHQTDDPEEVLITLSEERLSDIDADVLFYVAGGGTTSEEDARQTLKRLEANPLWSKLRAVRAGRLHPVDPAYWFIGGVRAADLILTDLFRYVAGKD
jgi:iron complex transport system substrate-binding protein